MPPKYPRQQLKSVSIEVFFPGQLEILSRFGQIQREVGGSSQLSQLFVPNVQAGEPIALRPYQLRDVEGTRSLALAVNQVAYIAFDDYPGFESFREEALPKIRGVLESVEVENLSRVRYLYENEVGLQDRSGFEVSGLFPGVVPAGVIGAKVLSPFHSAAEWLESEDLVGFNARIEGSDPVLKVGLFASATGALALEGLEAAVERLHGRATHLFEAIISDQFRSLISEDES